MPKTYAYIVDGAVREIILPFTNNDGEEVPIEDRYTADFVKNLIDITDLNPAPDQQWTYAEGKFAAPVPYQPSVAEVLTSNTSQRDALMGTVNERIAILTDATDPDIVDAVDPADTAALKKWKLYRIALSKIDLTKPAWPTAPSA
jgi:Caudovirales tail fibre assembly protein, lambda gpK